jgi:hypothetical protein
MRVFSGLGEFRDAVGQSLWTGDWLVDFRAYQAHGCHCPRAALHRPALIRSPWRVT